MDREKALQLYDRSNWDGAVPDDAWYAANACEVAGLDPQAGWIEEGAKTCYWFATDDGVLAQVTDEHETRTVAIRRPKWDALRIEFEGDPRGAAFEFSVRLFEKAAETILRGKDQSAVCLQRFYKDHLLKMMSS